MSTSTFIILLFVGLAIGLFSGMFGLGGGLFLIPALVFFVGMSQRAAQGTSIAIMLLPIGLFAFLNFYKAGHVNIRYSVIIALSFMIGSFIGSSISLKIPDYNMSKIFGWILLIISLKYILYK